MASVKLWSHTLRAYVIMHAHTQTMVGVTMVG